MEKQFLVYNSDFVIRTYLEVSKSRTIKRLTLAGDMFGDLRDSVVRYFVLSTLGQILKNTFQSEFMVEYSHILDKIMIREILPMTREIVAYFPYGEYDQYLPLIKEMNDLVGEQGSLSIFANNVPYCLEAGIVIEVDENYDSILEQLKCFGFDICYSKGENELFLGMREKQCNMVSIPANIELSVLKEYLRFVFLLPPKSSYEEKGYGFSNYQKKKLFVSYSHKNKELVHKIIGELRSYGLDFWLDEEQIDVGERLMERIHQGILECDLPVVFLSQETKSSAYAMHELQSFFTNIIYQKTQEKSWFIVRLDDVNPNDISFGLGDFKYFHYTGSNSEELVKSIKKKLGLN